MRVDSLGTMKEELRSRGEALVEEAQAEFANYLDLIRRMASSRLDDIDTNDLRRRADRVSTTVSDTLTDALVDGIDTVRERIRPRPRRRAVPVGLIAIGGAAVGAGLAIYFLGRRQEVRERFTELTGNAQRQLPQLVGKVRGNGHNGQSFTEAESQLRTAVEQE